MSDAHLIHVHGIYQGFSPILSGKGDIHSHELGICLDLALNLYPIPGIYQTCQRIMRENLICRRYATLLSP